MASYTAWKHDDWTSRATPLATILLGVFSAAWLLPKCIQYVRLAAIPTIGADLGGEEQRRQAYLKSARKLYNDGYRKVSSCNLFFVVVRWLLILKRTRTSSSKMASSRSPLHAVRDSSTLYFPTWPVRNANRVVADSTIIVLAPKFLAELNKLPNNVLSMEEAVNDVSLSRVLSTYSNVTGLELTNEIVYGDQVHKD